LYLLIYKNVNNKQGDFTMFSFIKSIFGSKPADAANEVPYKVETPVEAPAVQQPTPVAEKVAEVIVKSVAKPAPKKSAVAKPKIKPSPRKSKPKA
jgi:outer membrane biosynthesis protein TonB